MTLSRIAVISGVVRADQVVGELDGVLRAGDFGGMQAAVDVHDHFAVVRERVRLLRRSGRAPAPAARAISRYFSKSGQILRRRNDGDIPVAALGGLADLHQLQLVGGRGELLKIPERFVVAGEIKIVSRLVPEHRFGRRNLRETANWTAGAAKRYLIRGIGYHFRGCAVAKRSADMRALLPSKRCGRVAQVDRASAF